MKTLPTNHRLQVATLSALLVSAALFSQNAAAGLFQQNLNYSASQSMWGPGGSSADFHASGSTSVGVVDLFAYELGASSGTVQARHNGALNISYADLLATPATTTLNLGWAADSNGGLLKSDLGAFIDVSGPLGITILDRDYGLNISKTHNPTVPDSVSGTDTTAGIKASVAIPLIAEAGAELRPEQTSKLDVVALTGNLAYTLRGSGMVDFVPFALDLASGLSLDFNLGQAGIWDFFLLDDPVLENLYTASFDMELVLFEEHSGVTGCIQNSPIGCIIPRIGTIRNEKVLASLDVWDRDPFGLSFANSADLGMFSINVAQGVVAAVPEPGILSLLGIGLLGIGLTRRGTQRRSGGARRGDLAGA